MRRIKEILRAGSLAIVVASSLAVGLPAPAAVDTANVPSLVISQLKITGSNGQFITLYNATKLTPGSANIINQPPAAKKAAAKTTASKSQASKAAAKTKGAKTSAASACQAGGDPASTTPIHLWTLALVAAAALLYGAYEYRADLANRFYQFRSYFAARREDRT